MANQISDFLKYLEKYLQGSEVSEFKNIYKKNTIYCGF
jgi:hypothetical protein